MLHQDSTHCVFTFRWKSMSHSKHHGALPMPFMVIATQNTIENDLLEILHLFIDNFDMTEYENLQEDERISILRKLICEQLNQLNDELSEVRHENKDLH